MGKGHVHEGGGSLTEESFKYMAEKWGMSLEETKKEVYEMLKEEFDRKN